MTTADLFSSSSTEIPLADLLAAQPEHPRAEHLAQLVAVVGQRIPAAQRAKALTRLVVMELPVEICCIFLDGPGGMTYAGGMEWQQAAQTAGKPVLRQPGQAMRHRLHRIATRARGSHEPRQRLIARPKAVWRAYLTVPLFDAEQDVMGTLVLGRRQGDFAAEDVVMASIAARAIPATLAPPSPPPIQANEALIEGARALLAALEDGALVVAEDFTIRLLNPAFQALTGWDMAILGRRCSEVIRCHDGAGIAFCGTVRCPLYLAAKPPGGPPAPRATVRIDQAKMPDREVRIGGAVTPGIGRLLLLRPSNEAVTNTQREAFLSDLAHKLRNRFNSINGFVELVATDHLNPITPEQRKMLGYAHNSSLELLEYIENLLYLTRNDLGQAPLMRDRVTAQELLHEVEQHVALEAASVPLTLVRDAAPNLPPLHCDRTRLRQAVMNLVTNAIKFTPPAGEVRLSARVQGTNMLISVADTGIGIAPEDLPYLFERDYSSDRTARLGKNGGGMGLATAKAIVEQHGGTLTCASEIDHGATFTMRLPLG